MDNYCQIPKVNLFGRNYMRFSFVKFFVLRIICISAICNIVNRIKSALIQADSSFTNTLKKPDRIFALLPKASKHPWKYQRQD